MSPKIDPWKISAILTQFENFFNNRSGREKFLDTI